MTDRSLPGWEGFRMRLTVEMLVERLWATTEILRGALPVHEHHHYISVLLFLKYVSDQVAATETLLGGASTNPGAKPPLYIPRRARWEALRFNAAAGGALDAAMSALEQENPELEGVFRGVEFRTIDPQLVERLVEAFSALDLRDQQLEVPSVVGEVFQALFERAAANSRTSEGMTPAPVAELMVGLLDPSQGMSVYDPASGVGTLLTRCGRYVGSRGHDRLHLVGREKNIALWARGRMNLILHGLFDAEFDLGDSLHGHVSASSVHRGQFDRVIVDPPFGLRNWSTGLEEAKLAKHFPFGIPPQGSGDYAWIQIAYSALREGGKAVLLLPAGVLFRGGVERAIRQMMLEAGAFDAVISLPPNLLYGTSAPAVVLILKRGGSRGTDAPIYVLDVAPLEGEPLLGSHHLKRLLTLYHNREELPGRSRNVDLSEIAANDYVLSSKRYLHSEARVEALDLNLEQARLQRLERRRNDLAAAMDRLLNKLGS